MSLRGGGDAFPLCAEQGLACGICGSVHGVCMGVGCSGCAWPGPAPCGVMGGEDLRARRALVGFVF